MKPLMWLAIGPALLCMALSMQVFSQNQLDTYEMRKLIQSKKAVPENKTEVVNSQPAQHAYNAAEHEEDVKAFFRTLIDKSLQNPEQLNSCIDPQLDSSQTTIVSTLIDLSALRKSPADSLQIQWRPSSRISAPVLYQNKYYTQVQLLLDVTIKCQQPGSTLEAVRTYSSSMSYRLDKMLLQTFNPGYKLVPAGTVLERFDPETGEGHLILFDEVWLSRRTTSKTWQVTRTDGRMNEDYMRAVLIPQTIRDKADASLRLQIPKDPDPDLPAATLLKSDTLALSQLLDGYFQSISNSDTAGLKNCLAPSLSLHSEPKNILATYGEFQSIATVQVKPAAYQMASQGLELNGKRFLTMLALIVITWQARGEEGREVLKMTYPMLQTTLGVTGELIRDRFQIDKETPLIEFEETSGKLTYYSQVPTYLVASSNTGNWKVVFEAGDLPVGVVGH
jgi:hypothetical protein